MLKKVVHNDATITFRLPSLLKNNFVKRCEEQNKHYQKVIRELITEYTNKPIRELEEEQRERYLKTQRLL